MILVILSALAMLSNPPGLQNGDFRGQADGRATAWEPVGRYRALPDGGPNGRPALEMENDGTQSNGAVQVLRFDPPRRGGFVVTAWARCVGVEEGGDCALWLDVLQADGPPIWGVLGLPDRGRTGWQQVRAEVRPVKPVRELQVYLLLRKTNGKVRFCDVRVEDLPFSIRSLRLYAAGGPAWEMRAALSEELLWRARAEQDGREVWSGAGMGAEASARFETAGRGPVTLRLEARRNGRSVRAATRATPRPDAMPLDWWIADSFTRVFQDDLPPAHPTRRTTLEMARGEREAFQVCLRACAKPLRNVHVAISDLHAGANVLPASRVTWERVGFVWTEVPFQHPHAPRRSAAWWPDPLLPPVPFTVERDSVQPLWLTVYVPPETLPGDYRGTVTVTADGTPPVFIPLTVRTYPFVVSAQGRMKTAFALMDGHLRKVYGGIPPTLRRAYTDFLLDHRLNPDDISRTDLPDLEEMEYANTRGLNAFNILNVVPEPDRPVLWTCFAPLDAYTPEFRRRFLERLERVVPELRRRGLLGKAYVYGFDERGPEYIPVIRDLFGEIKRRWPEVKTLSTCWPPAGTDPLSLNVDWFVPLSASYDPKMAHSVRQRGGEMWWYVCMGPNHPYANWLLENPLIEARLIWWQAFQNDVEGFLYWGLNIWERANNDRPIPNNAGPHLSWSVSTGGDYRWLNGDGVLLYPGENGPLSSIRLENIRDGLEDTELQWQYRTRYGAEATSRLLRRVTQDRTHFSRETADLLGARRKLLRALR